MRKNSRMPCRNSTSCDASYFVDNCRPSKIKIEMIPSNPIDPLDSVFGRFFMSPRSCQILIKSYYYLAFLKPFWNQNWAFSRPFCSSWYFVFATKISVLVILPKVTLSFNRVSLSAVDCFLVCLVCEGSSASAWWWWFAIRSTLGAKDRCFFGQHIHTNPYMHVCAVSKDWTCVGRLWWLIDTSQFFVKWPTALSQS